MHMSFQFGGCYFWGFVYKTYKKLKIEKFGRLVVILDSATRAQFRATRAQSRATERNSEKCSLPNLNLNIFGDSEYFFVRPHMSTPPILKHLEKNSIGYMVLWKFEAQFTFWIDVLVCPALVPGRATLSWPEFPTWRQIALEPEMLRWTLTLWSLNLGSKMGNHGEPI